MSLTVTVDWDSTELRAAIKRGQKKWLPMWMYKVNKRLAAEVVEAYSLQGVRFLKGLIEMVEPSSDPAAMGWDRCA
jgi:hypothetical protein